MGMKLNNGEMQGKIAYVKPVDVVDLPKDIQQRVGEVEIMFALHDADGERLALVPDRAMAFALARQNNMNPVTLQ